MKGLIKMAQTKTKVKSLRKLSMDYVNSIEFISGRDLKKKVVKEDKENTQRQHEILDKHNGQVILQTKDNTYKIWKTKTSRKIIDVGILEDKYPEIYKEVVKTTDYFTINYK